MKPTIKKVDTCRSRWISIKGSNVSENVISQDLSTMNKFGLAFLIASLASCYGSGVPTFSWLQNPQPVLKITYPNGLSDIAVLKSYNPIPVQSYERLEDVDPCIYDGYLANEKAVYVTLTGCARTDTFNVRIKLYTSLKMMTKIYQGSLIMKY